MHSAENKCDKCDKKHAYCEKGTCKCKPPYTGDGITCNEPEELASKLNICLKEESTVN